MGICMLINYIYIYILVRALDNLDLMHWGQDKMVSILQTTFSNAFSWMKMLELRLKFHLSLFSMVQLIISQHWFRWWPGAEQASSNYLNQWWSSLLKCVTWPQWVTPPYYGYFFCWHTICFSSITFHNGINMFCKSNSVCVHVLNFKIKVTFIEFCHAFMHPTHNKTYQWLSARLQYLQCYCTGDNAVLH